MKEVIFKASNLFFRLEPVWDFVKASIAWFGIIFALCFLILYVSTGGFLLGDFLGDVFTGVESFGRVK